MTAIPGLEYLNGLPLEREILGHSTENSDLASDDEFEDDDAGGLVNTAGRMNVQEPEAPAQTNMDIFNNDQL